MNPQSTTIGVGMRSPRARRVEQLCETRWLIVVSLWACTAEARIPPTFLCESAQTPLSARKTQGIDGAVPARSPAFLGFSDPCEGTE